MSDRLPIGAKSRNAFPGWLMAAVFAALLPFSAPIARADQSIAVLVNDEPITTYDVAQRQRFLGLSANIGEIIQGYVKSPNIQNEFVAFAKKSGLEPRTQEDVEKIKKQFVEHLQKRAIDQAAGGKRQAAIDELIQERLQIQAAKKQGITVSEDEVNQPIAEMAKQKQMSIEQFLGQLRERGVDPNTFRERIRAQLAWRNLILRLYGARVQSAAAPDVSGAPADGGGGGENAEVDLRIVRLSLPQSADQAATARRVMEAETVRKQFSSCEKLDGLVKPLSNATVKAERKAKISSYPAPARAMLIKATAGQMTAPVVNKDAVEAYAVCSKKVSAGDAKKDAKADKRQEEFGIYSRRHLKDIRQNARIDYPKGN